MEPRKQAILDALDAFVRQRSGMEFGNYGDVKSFRAEQRRVTRDLHDYRAIRQAVALRDSITADMLLEASRSAFSGRLEIVAPHTDSQYNGHNLSDHWYIAYCTGQYFPTEYRKAACAVLASALWYWTREHAMPAPKRETGKPDDGLHELYNGMSAGDWLRKNFRREFGRHIASRYFD